MKVCSGRERILIPRGSLGCQECVTEEGSAINDTGGSNIKEPVSCADLQARPLPGYQNEGTLQSCNREKRKFFRGESDPPEKYGKILTSNFLQ